MKDSKFIYRIHYIKYYNKYIMDHKNHELETHAYKLKTLWLIPKSNST